MGERHRVLNKADLDAARRLHFGANDAHCLFAALIGIGSHPRHGMNVRTTEAALPMFWRMWSDIADLKRAAPCADPERLGKAVQRALRKRKRLQPFVSETNVDRESRSM